MSLTLSSVVPRLLAIPSPGERLPLELLRDLVREGWTELQEQSVAGRVIAPAWGPGIAMLLIGVANWGVQHWDDHAGPPDPAGRKWTGPAHKSGKHLLDGSSAYPYGGLGCVHLDSGGLLDAYERWGYPEGHRVRWLQEKGKPIVFDVLRASSGPLGEERWRDWLAWADALLARPEFHEWLCALFLRKFWAPSWAASDGDIGKACMLTRVANSASSWARKWADLSTDEIERKYIEAKREGRGEDAAKRTGRQVGFARRAAAAIEAVRVEPLASGR